MRRPGRMLRQVLRTAMHRPATVRYPFVKVTMPAKFRGKLCFNAKLCIGCKMCMRDCPSNAINIRKVGEKQFEADLDMSKCLYCAQCVDSCPKKALLSTEEFELAQLDRTKLQVGLHENVAANAVAAADAASAAKEQAESKK
jgi:formate hydrogenlyase subunit 6/NADH:ubiquinone oxidoreductase subunit I